MGVVPTKMGFAIRVLNEKLEIARMTNDNEVTSYVGRDTMLIEPTDQNTYIIQGIDSNFSKVQAAMVLHEAIGWSVKPLNFLGNRDKGKSNLKVCANEPPVDFDFKVGTDWIKIVKNIPWKERRTTVWEKNGQRNEPSWYPLRKVRMLPRVMAGM